MLPKDDLVVQIEAIITTLCQITEHFGKSIKLPIEGDTEAELKEGKEMYDQHLKFLGAVGLVNEYTINDNNSSISVTISPHIIGFYAEFFNEIELIEMSGVRDKSYPDKAIEAFKKMFPQDREHCSRCCPVIEEEMEIDE